MSKAAKVMIESLKREGVDHIFSLPGTTILDLFDALYDDKDIRLIVTRHEQGAAFMADGYTRASGKPSVCMASRGPGAMNMAIGVHNAYMESSPIIALIGQVEQDISLRDAFEEMDLVSVFRPFTKWSVEIQKAERIPELVQRAIRMSISGRPRPVMISVPMNLQKVDIEEVFWPKTNLPRPRASARDIEMIIDLILRSNRPVVLAGGGINSSDAYVELLKFSEFLRIPTISTWGRNDVFPNDNVLFLGAAGVGAAKVTLDYLASADLILAIGCRFSEFTTMRYSFLKSCPSLIHIDIDSEGLSRVFSPTIGVLSDAKLALEDLLNISKTMVNEDYRTKAEERLDKEIKEAKGKLLKASMIANDQYEGTYVHPGILMQHIQETLREDTIIVIDAGSFMPWASRYYQYKQPKTMMTTAGGSMGFALPAAIGAQLAQPNRKVVAITGDGGFMMVLQELETAVRYRIPIIVIVMNNFSFGNVKEKQIKNYAGRVIGCDYSNPDFAQLAKLFGAYGERIEKEEQIIPAMGRALKSDRPSVLDVMIDPDLFLPPLS
jgi:acetolactate synthase-1/2/3 large subunit